MDLGPALPPYLLTVAAPLGRGPPDLARPPGAREADGSPTVAPFDLLLQLLVAGMPAGQTLPAGGSDLPAAADATPSTPAPTTAAPSVGTPVAPAQPAPTDLADWLRLALARAVAPQIAAPTDAPADGAAPAPLPSDPNAPPPTPIASAPGPSQADAAPLDLRALLGADSAPPAAQTFAAVANAPRERAASDTSRRAAASVTPAEQAAQLVASDLASTDAQRKPEIEAPAVAVVAPAASAKIEALDDSPSLVVAPATGADSTAASTALPPLAHALAPNAATTTASAAAQSSLPQHPGDAVDTTAARWHDALATRIQWLVDHDVGEAKIKLNPPELGALDVKISLLDDKTYVQMTAHSASARDELAQGLPRLRELLSAGGLELGGATVSGGHDDRGAFGPAPQPIARAAPFAATAEALPDSPRPRLGTTSAVIDTFA
jgi:flagellar hook-length control protein FliK